MSRGEQAFYNAYTLDAVIRGLETLEGRRIHPRVVEWAVNENLRYHKRSSAPDLPPYFRRVGGEWKLRSDGASHVTGRRRGPEYGIDSPEDYETLISVHKLDTMQLTPEQLFDQFDKEACLPRVGAS